MILFLRDCGYQKIIIEKLPFISNSGSDCAVCFYIDCSGMGRREGGDYEREPIKAYLYFFLFDSVKLSRLTVMISS